MTDLFNVGVVGIGYVGLTTGACLARIGHRVTCVDKNANLVTELGEGRMPFYEPGLEELVEEGVQHGRLRFSTDLAAVVRRLDVVFIAVDTPQGDDGSADLSSVGTVARGIGRVLAEPGVRSERPPIVVNKSTVPVGSGNYVSMLVQEGIEEVGAYNSLGLALARGARFMRCPDITRGREVLGWEPRFAAEEGLGWTFEWSAGWRERVGEVS